MKGAYFLLENMEYIYKCVVERYYVSEFLSPYMFEDVGSSLSNALIFF
jgi:hypothetical protein